MILVLLMTVLFLVIGMLQDELDIRAQGWLIFFVIIIIIWRYSQF